jgi:uncharacterized protein YkwD
MLGTSRYRVLAIIVICALASTATLAIAAGPASAKLVAPRSKCAGQQNSRAPEPQQEKAMRCLINFARDHSGAGNVNSQGELEKAAGRKSGDVMRCGFSHTACGRAADTYPRRYGYMNASSWSWGENLAWGRGKLGTARNILKAWLNSPPHRETMLNGRFEHLGLGLKRGSFSGHANAAVWVLELGCHGC